MKSILLALAFVSASPAFAAANVETDSVVLTGSHASQVRALLNSVSARTRNFIMIVGQLSLEGRNVRMEGTNLGQISGINDAGLNNLGNAFGVDAAGTVFIRGTLAAYLVDVRTSRFECRNIQNSGAIGFPGAITSACIIR